MNGLHIEYANENNPHKVGDVISDHSITIKIQKISVSFGSQRIPQCVYDGIILKKDGTPNVRGKTDTVYQANIKVSEKHN